MGIVSEFILREINNISSGEHAGRRIVVRKRKRSEAVL